MAGTRNRIMKYLFVTGLKLSLVGTALLGIYLIYLDSSLTERFQQNRYQAPALIYGRSLQLEPGLPLTLAQVELELQQLQYRKVSQVNDSGQYAKGSQRLHIYRRPFDFPSGPTMAEAVQIDFDTNGIQSMSRLPANLPLESFELEPPFIGRIAAASGEDRLLVGLEVVPNLLIETLLMIEDQDFYHHAGVSLTSIGRAALANLAAMRTVQGGSTLTQQLVKNLYLTREQTLWRKANEALMALIIDYRFSKNEILETYLNEVYFGQDRGSAIHGVGLASRFYFGKQVQELDEAEIALLIAIIKGPSYYDPRRYPERAQQRRDMVLQLMFGQNLITRATYETAVEQPLVYGNSGRLVADNVPHYLELVRHELAQTMLPTDWQQQGLRIFTYLDPVAQRAAEQALQSQLSRVSDDPDLQGAVVVADAKNYGITAVVGDRNPRRVGFNRAVAAFRPVGSLIKPFVYVNALSGDTPYELASIIEDTPITLANGADQRWSPENFDKEFKGDIMLYDAFIESRNVPAVRLGMSTGIDRLVDTLQAAGVDSPIPAYPSLTLGAVPLAPVTVSEVFVTLANHGRQQPLRTIAAVTNHAGLALYRRSQQQPEQAFSDIAAQQVVYGLRGVVNEGTGRALAARFGKDRLAGKSGTTNDYRDSWFVAFDARQVVTVWVGRDDNKPVQLTGSSGALPVVGEVFAQTGIQPLTIQLSEALTMQNYHRDLGVLIPLDCAEGRLLPGLTRAVPERQTCAGTVREEKWWERWF